MKQRVLDVGNCAPDHAAIVRLLTSRFDAEVQQADAAPDALQRLREEDFALVLVNRKLDVDYSDGIEVVRAIKADSQLEHLPVMLITNYPEHQEAAIAAGAVRGFGKLEFDAPETTARLAEALGTSQQLQ